MQEAPIHQSHVYGRIKILRTIFEKGRQKNIPVKLFQNLTSSFGEDFLRISSCPCIVQEAPIHQSHVFGRIKISQTILEKRSPKEHSCEIISKSDKRFRRRRFFKNFFMSIFIRAPIHQSHVYGRIKISRTLFEKGHPRNIPVKLFQNLTSGFGEDFLRISSCPCIVQEAPIH